MGKIELRIIEHNGIPIERHWHAVFGIGGGTIGRGGQNKLIISDSAALVARVHAMVRLDADGAYIANLSESKPMTVAGEVLGSGVEVALPLGTHVCIGPYRLCAVAPGTPFVVSGAIPSNATASPISHKESGAPSLPSDSFDPVANPWMDVAVASLGSTSAHELQFPSIQASVGAVSTGPRLSGHHPLIPDDFNPFEPSTKQAVSGHDEWNTGLPTSGLNELFPQQHDALVRTLPLQGGGASPLDDPSHTGLPACFEAAQTLDPLALFDRANTSPSVDPAIFTAPRGSELGQAFSLPRVQRGVLAEGAAAAELQAMQPETPPAGLIPTKGLDLGIFESPENTPSTAVAGERSATVPQHAVSSSNSAKDGGMPHAGATETVSTAQVMSLERLAQAFVAGAGLDPSKARLQITPEFMHTFGEVLRIAMQGTIDLLSARSEIKREFRAGATVIASGANNPLKFLPSAEGVLMQMINHTFPGFMKPLPAMEEAYADLRVHQLALMAGIRAAYAEALSRFDPAELERRSDGPPGLLDKILINGRKAALWDDYKHNFDALRLHAEDDLTAFSGRTFVDAYEQAEHMAKGGG